MSSRWKQAEVCANSSRWGLVTVFIAGLMTMAMPAKASLVFNGSFENVGSATSSFSIDYASDAPNNQLAGWTATPNGNQILNCLVYQGATTNLCGSNAFGGGLSFWTNPGESPDGGNYVAIDGVANYSTPLTQTVSGLTVGATYILSFYQAAAQQQGFDGATTEQWKVSLGSQTKSSTLMNNTNHGDVPWMQQTMTFTATATSEVLTFLAVGTPGGEPPFVLLDGVTLTQTPEPQTLVIIGVGLVAISLLRKLPSKRKGS